ncbi:protein phosphatase 2C [Necator americanus]|uniref:Protein phosphatase 2C n=1 Tax=Necator americanus TaxID=51031 RepID=W2T6Q9_NECAM|nr:protein phosphatase 2C [Necator americanus]ETN77695.1 protein phosphatase 2C [Necator americanus]
MASRDVNGVDAGDNTLIDVEIWKDETGKTVVQHLSEGFAGDDEAVADGAILRYRAPFLRVIKHDAYFDAFNIVVESMLNRLAPMWLAYTFAEAFVNDHANELTAHRQDYIEARPDSWDQFPISCESEKGRRPRQEDRMLAMPTLTLVFPDAARSDVGLMAVFDGHGGSECSAYSCAHLPAEFVRALNAHPSSLESSLQEAFERLDARLSARCENERWRSGTTAVAVAVDSKQIVVGWIGDSAAYVLSESNKLQKITRAHVPTNEDEARRVEEDGGQLLYVQGELRVNGVLNLTRALGDIGGRPMISPKADTTVIERDVSHYLVLLACDGVSELFSDSEVLDMIKSFVEKHSYKQYYDLSDHICQAALAGGSIDNVTCVAVFLRPPKDLWELLREDSDK